MKSDNFYPIFEDRFRGSRESIMQRLDPYMRFVEPLLRVYQQARAVDLGCGRGEWIELLNERGFLAVGIDSDAAMLSDCTRRELSTVHGDAVAHLQALADESQCAVSGIHFAEHISHKQLKVVIEEALRVLKPGGLLILETPNPENLVVGTNHFYIDPTHIRPIPPLLLSFLAEFYGFVRIKTLRLPAQSAISADHQVELLDVLAGVSPDYAIIAQKEASPSLLKLFDAAFEVSYGANLKDLADRYDRRLFENERKISQYFASLNEHAASINSHGKQLELLSTQNLLLMENVEKRVSEYLTSLDERLTTYNTQEQLLAQISQHNAAISERYLSEIRHLEDERNALRASLSWRITAPLRWVGSFGINGARLLFSYAHGFFLQPILLCERIIAILMRKVLRNPRLSYRLNQYLLRYPALHRRLAELARRTETTQATTNLDHADSPATDMAEPTPLAKLSPRARRIYQELKQAIDHHQPRT